MPARVLHVVRPVKGGIKKHLQLLFQAIDRERFILYLAAPPDDELCHALQPFVGAFVPVPIAEDWNPGRDWMLVRRLSHIIRSEGIDLVHTHGVRAGMLGQAAAVAAGAPVVATLHNLQDSGPMLPGWPRLLQALMHRSSRVRHVIVVSKAIRDQLLKFPSTPGAKISVVYNGIDAADFQYSRPTAAAADELGLDGRLPVIGAVARLEHRKGLRYLVKAMPLVEAACGPARLVIVGDGPERVMLQELARELGLAVRVVFAGFRPDVPALLQLFDIVAIPSVQEGLCFLCLEALACRRPVVACAVGGLPEIVEDGETGLLVPPADPEGLAAGIVALLRDRELAEALARKGQALVAERFTQAAMVRKTEAIYESILS